MATTVTNDCNYYHIQYDIDTDIKTELTVSGDKDCSCVYYQDGNGNEKKIDECLYCRKEKNKELQKQNMLLQKQKEIKEDKKPKYKYTKLFNDSVLSLSDKEQMSNAELLKKICKQQLQDRINDQRILLLNKLKNPKNIETKHKAKYKKRHKSKLLTKI